MNFPILFLDFDGVLNHIKWPCCDGSPFDPACVERVNLICRETGARIVVSSSWRMYEKESSRLPWLRGVMRGAGIQADVIALTPDLSVEAMSGIIMAFARADEIRMYLALTPAERFVILDDCADAGIDGHFVLTDYGVGITDANVAAAIQILGRGT